MSSEEEDENAVYCICRSSDVNRFMIGCDHCEEWYHGDCINVKERDAEYIKKYYCKICINKNPNLQIVYKSKYKEKETSGVKGSSHSKDRERESSKNSHEKHRDKYDDIRKKHKSEDKEKFREKDRDKRSERDKKYPEYKTHRSKHGHDNHLRKHHHRDKEYEDKEKRRDRDKHRHKNDRNLDRERRKAKEKRKEELSNLQKRNSAQEFQDSGIKSDSKKESELSSLKKETGLSVKSEIVDSSSTVDTEYVGNDKTHIEKIKNESGTMSPKHVSKIPYEKDRISQFELKEEKDKKFGIADDKVSSRKSSTDKDSITTPTSKPSITNTNKTNVLKELKNIPELDETLAMNAAIKSEEGSEEDSDERWTDKPLKSRKSKLLKETNKRVKSPNHKINKKRRHMDPAKNRRLARSNNYMNGDSSEEGNYSQFGIVNTGDLQQCFGHKCVKPARPQSNYCSDDCGINLASHRIVQTLPDRLREWHLTQCVADTRSRKELEKIRAEQDAVKNRLEQLNVDFQNLEELIDRGKLQPIEREKEDEEEGDTDKPSEAEMTVHCVTCGQDLHTKTAIRHMERCYNKFESQTSFASKFKTQIENHRMFCDYFNPKDQTYCKRLQVLCPEHNPDPKFLDDEVCGYPIQKEIFAKPTEFCRLSKKCCQPHVFWEKLRRAEIDMERVRQWMKVDELLEQERIVKAAMSNRAGVLGLLLHSTFNHELDDRYKAAQEAQRAKIAAQAKAKQAAQMMAVNQNKSLTKQHNTDNHISSTSQMVNMNAVPKPIQY